MRLKCPAIGHQNQMVRYYTVEFSHSNKPLSRYFGKSFILYVLQGFKCVSVLHETFRNVQKECHFRIARSLEVIKLYWWA